MSAEQHKAVFTRVIEEGFNKGNFAAWDDCFPAQYIEHQYGLPDTLEGFKKAVAGLRAAMGDFHLTIDDMVVDGDKLWVRMTGRGVHRAPFAGVPATNKSFAITVFDVCRFENGKIVEHWGVPDRFALLHQIGALGSR